MENNIIQPSPVEILRKQIADENGIVVCPGVYDGLSARVALHAGFKTLYMTGSGTAVSRLGMPDIGLTSLNDMKQNAELIANLDTSVPLIADADTGFGGALMVGRTVAQYMRAGVAALHLEDQVMNKRCGHLRNKELVSEDEFLSRIRAAVNMRSQLSGDIVIIARTDTLQSLGFEVALDRLKKSIAIGADVAFLEGIRTIEQARTACRELHPTPVLYNMVQGGVSPHLTVAQAKELGFRVIIYPAIASRAAYMAITKAMNVVREKGDFPEDTGHIPPSEMYRVCGLDDAIKFDLAAGSNTYNGGI
ncbi:Pyruvate/Phosphoenolpyruvate kinase-like domain-containing protein [Talaromyces proteolyticus]|uniref:Pyruvate/Phosphoenolpyruvate kinase-like domain-containing protein n=1 Tax=Talaromyces proteolyticus TaxID=1131652 RepID=A0AAD4KUY7_9EURO|nr:Pyruvate/Phosphoenolpyruvate kinase-like domain-containing protein [Talaromyces proteolyticus]KAH8698904.1 Pyruvate/Phosphoenolpyruvate kinase-like domain-containing protein [Talaromyces proteolyticus]